jgi:hypothetical protein
MALLGSLVVQLAVDTARFQGDLGRAASVAESRMKNIKDTASRALGAVAVAAAAAGGALVAALKSGINRADEARDLAQALGLTTEELTRLEFAAKQGGATVEDLTTGMRAFSNQIAAAAGGQKTAVALFSALGIEVKNARGELKPTSELLSEVATRFARTADGAGKTAIAQDLFSRSGSKLIPVLNAGADGLKEMADQADRLGFTISTQTADAADAFNDQLGVLNAAVTGFKTKLAAELLPTLNALIKPFTDVGRAADGMDRAVRAASTAAKLLATIGTIVGEVFTQLGDGIGANAAAIVAFAKGNFSEAFSIIKDRLNRGVQDIRAAGSSISEIWSDLGEVTVSTAKVTGEKLAAPIIRAEEIVREKWQSIKDIGQGFNFLQPSDLENTRGDQFSFLDDLSKQLDGVPETVAAAMDRSFVAIDTFRDGFKNAFDDMINTGKFSFRDLTKFIIAELSKKAIFNAIDNIANAFKRGAGSSGTNFLGTLFGGIGKLFGFANGGRPPVGRPSIVGERGMELFVPDSAGTILPNHALGGSGSITINYYNTYQAGSDMELRQMMPALLKQTSERTVAQVRDLRMRGK